jgi:hypothetical protein
MFTRFEITGFRGFDHLAIESLARVNLIAGKNNVGKTALLEAMFLHIGAHNPELPLRVNAIRGIERFPIQPEEVWGWLFYDKRTDKPILLGSQDDQGLERKLEIRLVASETVTPAGNDSRGRGDPGGFVITTDVSRDLVLEYSDSGGRHAEARATLTADREIKARRSGSAISAPGIYLGATARFTSEDAERFSNLERVGKADSLLSALRLLEPRLTRLTVLVTAGAPMIHGGIGLRELMPLPVMGQGMVRLCAIMLAIANVPGGTLLVDEIENGLHHTVLPDVFKAIGQAARISDVQVFAATHSWECIEAAHAAFLADPAYDFRLHRLERVKGQIKDFVFDAESLGVALEAGLEVR